MNVTIDRMECVSCGACWNTCPELFEQNPCDSLSQIVEHIRFCGDRAEGILQENDERCAREAVNLCPVQIITITFDESEKM
ncbi:MAG: ferredoxin [Methanoregula sp.]|nr:ferredoxin [Methanoregula sp.]